MSGRQIALITATVTVTAAFGTTAFGATIVSLFSAQADTSFLFAVNTILVTVVAPTLFALSHD